MGLDWIRRSAFNILKYLLRPQHVYILGVDKIISQSVCWKMENELEELNKLASPVSSRFINKKVVEYVINMKRMNIDQ